ncbi:MAG: heavy metal translocating P-type ATPase, partial [Caldilineaceae bacterium]|nr:heavy metal translocating P-type ATPase [Caldilineaceae bacterium]
FFYLPLAWLSVPFTLYSSIDVLRDAKAALIEERKLRHSILDATVIVSALFSQYYLASALASLTYYTGHKLMAMTEDNAQQTLRKIMGEQPQVVWRLVDGIEVETPLTALQVGDVIVGNTGDTLPIDGYVINGFASIDQRLLSGEARPVEKEPGAPVYAGTTLLAGRIHVCVEKAGSDTVAAQIGDILLRTADYKSTLLTRGEEISDRSVLPTLGLSAVTLAMLGPASAVAVIGANYAELLRIVAPLSMLNFLAMASQQGILIKDGRALELLNDVDTVVFDKTGTLTLEQPHVTAIHTWHDFAEEKLLALAAAAEQRQNHPLARAIVEAAQAHNLALPTIDESRYEVGYGIKAATPEHELYIGSLRFMTLADVPVAAEIYAHQATIHAQGGALVYVAVDGTLAGAIELHATMRPEAIEIVAQMKARKLKLYILSGDHQEPTRRLAEQLEIDNFAAEVLPEEKAQWVQQLQAEGRVVCFVGDGLNDAIALKQAHTSISLRGASTAATDTAQIILTDESLHQLDQVFALAQRFNTNMRNNYITTFGPGLLCLGGIFFFNFQILSAMICYNASLVAGLGNAILPTLNSEANPSNSHHVPKIVQPNHDRS